MSKKEKDMPEITAEEVKEALTKIKKANKTMEGIRQQQLTKMVKELPDPSPLKELWSEHKKLLRTYRALKKQYHKLEDRLLKIEWILEDYYDSDDPDSEDPQGPSQSPPN